ncbi:hypothetical protein Efla_001795 [Eimeria flavescens]
MANSQNPDAGEFLLVGQPQRIRRASLECASIYNLVFASPACLAEYLDKLFAVQFELKASLAANRHFSHQQLQHILNETVRFAETLLARELADHRRVHGPFNIDWNLVDFQQKLVSVLLNFPRGPNEETPQLNYGERSAGDVVLLLQHHTKCIKILQLLHHLEQQDLWTPRAMISLVEQLCECPTEHLPARFEDLVPVYMLALNATLMPEASAERFMDNMPDEMRLYAICFRGAAADFELVFVFSVFVWQANSSLKAERMTDALFLLQQYNAASIRPPVFYIFVFAFQ